MLAERFDYWTVREEMDDHVTELHVTSVAEVDTCTACNVLMLLMADWIVDVCV
jgi:hypothetical protein